MFNGAVTVSDLQKNDVVVGKDYITGTLKYQTEGTLVDTWGEGYFLALKFSDIDTDKVTSVKVGLRPSQSSGLAELLGDPDMNGAFKITDKDTQQFEVVSTGATGTLTQSYKLSGLTLEPKE